MDYFELLETVQRGEATLPAKASIIFESKTYYALGYTHSVQFWDTPGDPIVKIYI